MNKVGIIMLTTVVILSFSSCAEKSQKEKKVKIEEKALNENFDWLLGHWKRNNEEEGKETFENWQKVSDTVYIGLGFTMQNQDTIKQEKIRLIKSGNNWNLDVQTPDDSGAITFKVTTYNNQEFTCENKELDFPQLIKYWKTGDKINALVSGIDMEISFEFEKSNKK